MATSSPAGDPSEPAGPPADRDGTAPLRAAALVLYVAFLVRLAFVTAHGATPPHLPVLLSTFGLGIGGLGLSIAAHLIRRH